MMGISIFMKIKIQDLIVFGKNLWNETLKQNSRDASTMLGQFSKQSCMILHDLFMLQIEERLSSLLCPSSYWHINSNELFF